MEVPAAAQPDGNVAAEPQPEPAGEGSPRGAVAEEPIASTDGMAAVERPGSTNNDGGDAGGRRRMARPGEIRARHPAEEEFPGYSPILEDEPRPANGRWS